MTRWGCPVVLLTALAGIACGGGVLNIDPLAPIPTHVDPQEIQPPQLRVEWKHVPQSSTLIEVPSDQDEEPFPPVTQSPAVDTSHVYTVHGDLLRALSLSDGHLQWELRAASEIVLAPLPVSGGIMLETADGRWLWVDLHGRLRAAGEPGDTALSAAATDAGIVVVDSSDAFFLQTSDLERAPVTRWRTEVPGASRITAAPEAGMAVIVTADGVVVGLTLTDGREAWRHPAPPVINARVAVDAKRAYVVGRDNRLRALRLRDGKQDWLGKDTGIRVVGAPAVAGKLVWIAGLDGALHGFDRSTGSHLHRVPMAGRSVLDLVTWGPWIVASPAYGPWTVVRGPLFDNGPSDAGQPVSYTIAADDDLLLAPGSGVAGVAAIDASGAVRLLRPPTQPVASVAEDPR